MVALLLWVIWPVQLFTKAVGCLAAEDCSTEGAGTRHCIERMKSSQGCCVELNPEPPPSLLCISPVCSGLYCGFIPVFHSPTQHDFFFF